MNAPDKLALGADNAERPRPLPSGLLPVEPFPIEALPDAFRPWVSDVCERMQCPPEFVAVPMLIGAASLAARHAAIRPQRLTDWTETGNLWALIVGRPGTMKSPALTQALGPLHHMESRAAADYEAHCERFKADELATKLRGEARLKQARSELKKNASADIGALLNGDDCPAEPVRARFIVQDATYEKLGEVLHDNPGGVLSVRDEMRSLFERLEREDAAQERGFYLQAWSGGSYTFDRIGRGTIRLADLRLSIIGGIQPGPLAHLMQRCWRNRSSDGLIERFLVAWPDTQGDWRNVDQLPDNAARSMAWNVFTRLELLDADELGADADSSSAERGLPFLRLTPDALAMFEEWRADLEARLKGEDSEGLEAALSKFRHHVPALALSQHLIDGHRGAIGAGAMGRALALAEYFESHARRLHASARDGVVSAARKIVGKGKAGALPEAFTARTIYSKCWAGLADAATVTEALDMLAEHGWLTECTLTTGGRPSTVYGWAQGALDG